MAAVRDVHHEQRAVIVFLVCEKQPMGNMHKRLRKVYRKDTANAAQLAAGYKEHQEKIDVQKLAIHRPQHRRTPVMRR
jgi:hypothetical protein